jgi:hypothetical protein
MLAGAAVRFNASAFASVCAFADNAGRAPPAGQGGLGPLLFAAAQLVRSQAEVIDDSEAMTAALWKWRHSVAEARGDACLLAGSVESGLPLGTPGLTVRVKDSIACLVRGGLLPAPCRHACCQGERASHR